MAADPRMVAAAEWVERLRDAGPAERRRFAAWKAHPDNDAAWQRIAVARTAVADMADDPALLGLRHAAVARSVLNRRPRRWPIWSAGAAAVAATLAVLTFAPTPSIRSAPDATAQAPSGPVYRTEPGQRLAVTLRDGSRLMLNTDSVVRVAYGDAERRLVLERGQALFEVAGHQPRPFVVAAGGREVVAHGTQFDVRLRSDATEVALIEGRVSVRDGVRRDRPIAMVPDDILTVDPTGAAIRHLPGAARALASWSEGRVEFSDAPLAGAVAEMNRYLPQPITIADDRAARLRISGAFRTGESAPFLAALTSGFPVEVHRQPGGAIRISSRR
ncbi:FecR family protein [Sphingomonas silueang]|uniref:FecR family protein n=1 Tax=Sphingomonas silueang TaxID=3156617 RepID=UPI0032B3BB3F